MWIMLLIVAFIAGHIVFAMEVTSGKKQAEKAHYWGDLETSLQRAAQEERRAYVDAALTDLLVHSGSPVSAALLKAFGVSEV